MTKKAPPSESDLYEFPLTLHVPRSAFIVVAPEPATVTQHTVEGHFGIPPRTYKRMVTDGLFAAKRIGRLVFSRYEDVKRALTEGATARTKLEKASSPRTVKEAPIRSLEAARLYLEMARSPRERRERKTEIEEKAWELIQTYGEKLSDDSSNPRHDKMLYDHGMDLVLVAATARYMTSPRNGVATTQPNSGYRKCTWCDRPAYATKQRWTGENWSGAPSCEVCGQNRRDDERVVTFNPDTILLPPRDPTVPTEWYAPRRRRKRTT